MSAKIEIPSNSLNIIGQFFAFFKNINDNILQEKRPEEVNFCEIECPDKVCALLFVFPTSLLA